MTTFFYFFRSTKLIFLALPKHCFAPILAKFSAPHPNFWKNSQKSRFWALFEKFGQKIAFFFGARSPSKLAYIGAKGTFRKILGSVGQKWISEKVSKFSMQYIAVAYLLHVECHLADFAHDYLYKHSDCSHA